MICLNSKVYPKIDITSLQITILIFYCIYRKKYPNVVCIDLDP